MKYRAERAISPDESVSWVVVDADYRLHVEGCAFLAGLRGADRSVNTERVYAGRGASDQMNQVGVEIPNHRRGPMGDLAVAVGG